MQPNFDGLRAQVEALRRASDLDGLLRLKARAADAEALKIIDEAIDNVTVIGLA